MFDMTDFNAPNNSLGTPCMTPLDPSRPVPRYAVIFRTHFWDGFTIRQMERLRRHVVHGHIFVLVDETAGRIEGISHDRVVRMKEADAVALGLARRGEQNLMWFNGDYPLYYFFRQYPDYEFFLHLEYDVVVNTDLDALVSRVARDQVDFVGLTKGEDVGVWAWRHTCIDAYAADDIRYQLICFSLLSRRAMQQLFTRRLELSVTLSEGQAWPYCEGFIATEMRLAGMQASELSQYVDTAAYDTWPPYLESDLPKMLSAPVIHPVLDKTRYIASLLKYKVGLIGYLNPLSLFHRKLRRLPVLEYGQALISSFTFKVRRNLRAGNLLGM